VANNEVWRWQRVFDTTAHKEEANCRRFLLGVHEALEMRNLVVLSESYGVIDRRDGNEKLQVVAAAVDTEAGHFFVATQSAMLLCFSLASSQVFFLS
jgi:hypothetical protein